MKITTRFAPSPTGWLHIGGLRTALYSFLVARRNKGVFRLRIEDTDQKRTVAEADRQLIEMLQKFGIEPDGEIVYQSKRMQDGVYARAAERLVQSGQAYPCFCTEERLAQLRHERSAAHQPPGYDGACRGIPSAEALDRRLREPHTIRLKWKDGSLKKVDFSDELRGTVSFPAKNLGDAILLKSDGFPTYHLASVVDDHDMGVTHVIRGEEWLPSAPLHDFLYTALSLPRPLFYHLPLILNPDKTKLSKRQGDVAVEDYLKKGYLKEALINYIAFLGWNPGGEREKYSLQDLIKVFSLEKLHTSPAIFDLKKLNWYNSEYITTTLARQNDRELYEAIRSYLPGTNQKRALQIFALFFERINALSDLHEMSAFLDHLPEYPASLLIFKKSDREKTHQGLQEARTALDKFTGDWTAVNLDLLLQNVLHGSALSPGDLFWPVRVALSGSKASPPPADLLAILGKDESGSRLAIAFDKISAS